MRMALLFGNEDARSALCAVVADDLLDETKENRDDDGCLESLTEYDEEDGDGEDAARHGGRMGGW
jgi:hypothetical protein